ncbi:MAG: entericidin A/B family lipoprotein [Rhodospirillaceae bacterium]
MKSLNSQPAARPSRRWPVALAVVATSAVLALGACNTMEGAGQDMQAAGAGLERESKDARD